MAKKVKESNKADLKKSEYFSFSVDSTPDISRTEQLSLIIRYVFPVNSLPSEIFIIFFELKDHFGLDMVDLTIQLPFDFNKCREQSNYDNAANIAVRCIGIKILKRKMFAKFFHAQVTPKIW